MVSGSQVAEFVTAREAASALTEQWTLVAMVVTEAGDESSVRSQSVVACVLQTRVKCGCSCLQGLEATND